MHAAELAKEGADIIDVGGESTRPGSDAVEEGEELSRVIPVLEGLAGLHAAISIDTRKACVARAAAKAGAKIFNDVSALTYDRESLAGCGRDRAFGRPHACQGRAQDHAGRPPL